MNTNNIIQNKFCHVDALLVNGPWAPTKEWRFPRGPRRWLRTQQRHRRVVFSVWSVPRYCKRDELLWSGVEWVRGLRTTFNLLYVYNYITKLCRQQAEVIQNHENEHVRSIGQGEARHKKYKRLKLLLLAGFLLDFSKIENGYSKVLRNIRSLTWGHSFFNLPNFSSHNMALGSIQPRRLANLWASTAWYRDNIFFECTPL
jgi:hypothetical protein